MGSSLLFRFPSDDAARRFVRVLLATVGDVACFRQGRDVWVVDGTHFHSRDVLHAALDLGGRAV